MDVERWILHYAIRRMESALAEYKKAEMPEYDVHARDQELNALKEIAVSRDLVSYALEKLPDRLGVKL